MPKRIVAAIKAAKVKINRIGAFPKLTEFWEMLDKQLFH
jgi:hypothetical protein